MRVSRRVGAMLLIFNRIH